MKGFFQATKRSAIRPLLFGLYLPLIISIGWGQVGGFYLSLGINQHEYAADDLSQKSDPLDTLPIEIPADSGIYSLNTLQLGFSTFLGTNSTGNQFAPSLRDIAFDSAGNIVVVGHGDISTSGFQGVPLNTFGTFNDGDAVIVAKLSKDGSNLLWVTLIGGNAMEKGGYGVALDPADNIYVAGTTHSTNFPTTPGAWDRTPNQVSAAYPDCFLLKLSSNGQNLIYSTYLGSTQEDSSRGGLTVDSQGYAYVVGSTGYSDFLDEGGVPNSTKVNNFIGGASDGFITKVSQNGSSIVFTRFIGSPSNQEADVVKGIKLDGNGNIYTASLIGGPNATTTDGSRYQGGNGDVYLTKISPDGRQLLLAEYFGGSDFEGPSERIYLDSQGNMYITGGTLSSDLPMKNANQPNYGGGTDGLLAKFNSNGTLVFSTYIGSSGEETTWGPGMDSQGNIYTVSYTTSPNLLVTSDAYDKSHNGNQDILFQRYSPTGQLSYSTYFGGSGDDYPRYVRVDSSDNVFFVAQTTSGNFPTTPGAYDATHNGQEDIAIVRIDASPGQFQFSGASYWVREQNAGMNLTVRRVQGSRGTVSVQYSTQNNSAQAGSDYQNVSGTLTFLDGETAKSFHINLIDDGIKEGSEIINLSLSNPTGGATLSSSQTSVIIILDNESGSYYQLYIPLTSY